MAERPTTPHYGIAKYGPQGTQDPMDVYRVYNVAMDTIDNILFEQEGEIADLKRRMDAAEAAIDALDRREAAHYTELTQAITDLDTKVENYNTAINNNMDWLESMMGDRFNTVNHDISKLDGKTDNIWTAIQNIINKVMGAGSVDKNTGSVSWPQAGTIPVGNINIFSGSGYIRTRAGEQDNDVKVV